MKINLNEYNVEVSTPAPFTGGTGNTRGDKDGALTSMTLFKVKGEVMARVYGVCTTTIVGAGTLEVGVAGNTALLIAQVADATTIAAGDRYIDASVAEVGGFAALPTGAIIGRDIIETSGTADLTAGDMYYVCLWYPITENGNVKAVVSRVN